MDSITQAVLGAACARVCLPQRIRKRYVLSLGAVLGTLPDLDVLVAPFVSDITEFVAHRSYSHSLLVLPIVALAVAWLCARLLPAWQLSWARWYLVVAVILLTHPLLDAFTSYGTQLFWPLSHYPVASASVFIIDPLFTLPLLWALWRWQPRAVAITLVAVSGYLLVGLAMQASARAHLQTALAQQAVPVQGDIRTTALLAAPFSSLWWQAIVVTERDHATAIAPFWADWRTAQWTPVPAPTGTGEVHHALRDHPDFVRLSRFSQGLYSLAVARCPGDGAHGRWIYTDLRFGTADSEYFFVFDLGARTADGGIAPAPTFTRRTAVCAS